MVVKKYCLRFGSYGHSEQRSFVWFYSMGSQFSKDRVELVSCKQGRLWIFRWPFSMYANRYLLEHGVPLEVVRLHNLDKARMNNHECNDHIIILTQFG